MAITDPIVVKFTNEVIRPKAERLVEESEDLARIDKRWSEIKALVPNTAEVLDDGRAARGVVQLTGAEIHQFMTILRRLQDFFGNESGTVTVPASVATKLAKPMVRVLR